MRHTLRRSILIALLVGISSRRALAQAAGAAPDTTHPAPQNTKVGRSNILPVVEIVGFLTLLNIFDRWAYPDAVEGGKKVYSSTFSSTWDHLREQRWVHDQDPFNTNQFEHPYQGAIMYGLARSSGHGFWTSLAHANVGSFMWKMAGETDPPSIDDMVTTGQAGSLLGEALYRMADLVIKDKITTGGKPNWWHTFLADRISPPRSLNRRIFGERFRAQLADSAPATSWQVRLGASLDALTRDISAPGTVLNRDAIAEFWMSYGLPGKPGYEYNRPLDYFDMQISFLSDFKNPVENVMLRGLLKGTKTKDGAKSRGIWGLYGTYDYISPFLFRVSSTAASLGTTRQYNFIPGVVLQSSLLGGVGYGAAGSSVVIPSTPTTSEIRDYHFGVTPQALVALRLIAYDRVMFDFAAREYYVSGLGSDDVHGSETIFRGNGGVSVRLIGGHTLGARFVASARNAQYGKQPSKNASEETVTLAYSYLGNNLFSGVKW